MRKAFRLGKKAASPILIFSTPSACPLQRTHFARRWERGFYTIDTDKQTFKMLGALVEGLSDDERNVYFVLDDGKNAHFENPNGGEQPVTLVAYQTEWKEAPANRKVLPVRRMSRDWLDAKLIGVQSLLVLWTPPPDFPFLDRPCTVSRPLGWVYILDVGGVTYDATWKKEAPLQLWVREDTLIAWRGSDRIYRIDNDEKERTLAVKKRTQPASERAPRNTRSVRRNPPQEKAGL